MNANAIIRRVDDLGRVVIPREVRKALNITEGAQVELYVEDGEIIIKPYAPPMYDLEITLKDSSLELRSHSEIEMTELLELLRFGYRFTENEVAEIRKDLENGFSRIEKTLYGLDFAINRLY